MQVRLNPKMLPVLGTQFSLEFGKTSSISVFSTRSAERLLSKLFDVDSLLKDAHPEMINKKDRRLKILCIVISRNLTFKNLR